MLIELTISWEEGIQAAYEHKAAKYTDLAAECEESGWSIISRSGLSGLPTTHRRQGCFEMWEQLALNSERSLPVRSQPVPVRSPAECSSTRFAIQQLSLDNHTPQ
ncbi:uncharacterized protein LOC133151488 [Syngnathus typhle]|uniref:uncharacterized protein LOC133151488 n=1 Tax=Syngnathus typhle TaxID=161592 RepID=UPI002A6A25D7|nr:uncharacterized protein LOC133151488 [Syngnathus typhle]